MEHFEISDLLKEKVYLLMLSGKYIMLLLQKKCSIVPSGKV